ncbi:outer membrane protein [Marinobacter salarius]|uniref:Outer membrane protein beta-barrel domain protein n=1 Tax=Marinobacter salarius TaxID=1420917 RepID=A0A1W6KFW8_9GAMM|nr:outer membrane beta-barrel protein [Marinobacter salarius]ARM86307.1 outer membrane protein beta-barrel domain protein [Marinobacter salarius]
MFKKTAIAASLIAGSFFAHQATAADTVFYTGLNAGWNATEFELEQVGSMSGNPYTSQETLSASGPAYGGVLGMKFPISTGFIGIEANISDSGAEFEREETLNGSTILDQVISSDLGYGLTGILAFNVNAHSQIYGLAGYKVTTFEYKVATRNTGSGNVTSDSNDDSLGGIKVGIGYETALTSSMSARFEWATTMYDSEEFDVETSNGTVNTALEATESRVTVGIIGHF